MRKIGRKPNYRSLLRSPSRLMKLILIKFYDGLLSWMIQEKMVYDFPLCDFEEICKQIKPGDVLLVEGRSRISQAIRVITNSVWSHAMIYIGAIETISSEKMRFRIANHLAASQHLDEQYLTQHSAQLSQQLLVIESFMGKGTIVTPLELYKTHHIRICRPDGLSKSDIQRVINYCTQALGQRYNVKQIFRLLFMLIPTGILPRRLVASLFKIKANTNPTGNICSSLLAEAFNAVEFPILPTILINEQNEIELIPRNPSLFTPGDFDYSPYFNIIKYPIFGMIGSAVYHQLPWNSKIISDDYGLFRRVKRK